MKKILLYTFFLFITGSCFSQYYYKDLLVIEAGNKKHQLLKSNKVKSIKFLSFDSENKPIEGFSSDQQISRDYREVITKTTSTLTGPTENKSTYNNNSQVIKTVDSSEGSSTTILYEYGATNRITRIISTTISAGGFQIKEEHQWIYNATGQPVKMVRIKNDKDTSTIEFVLDEKGLVVEEKAGSKGLTYYYYYEDNNLTDIVRYNRVAKRLLPDYVFEYEGKDRLASMLVVPEEGSEYQKWYYSYDEDGLKILDACYSKTKQLIGRIEYEYDYYK